MIVEIYLHDPVDLDSRVDQVLLMGQVFFRFIVGDNIGGEILPVIAAPRTVVGLQPLLLNFFVIRLRSRVALVVCDDVGAHGKQVISVAFEITKQQQEKMISQRVKT